MRGTDIDRIIGKRIRQVRNQNGMSQAQLRDACLRVLEIRGAPKRSPEWKGYHVISISEMERGLTKVPAHRLEVIAEALGIEPSKLQPAEWQRTDRSITMEMAVQIERLRKMSEKRQREMAPRLRSFLDAWL